MYKRISEVAAALIAVPIEVLLEELLFEYLLFLILLLNLAELVRLVEAVHLLEPLLMLPVHLLHEYLVLSSNGRVTGCKLECSENAFLGGLELTVFSLCES